MRKFISKYTAPLAGGSFSCSGRIHKIIIFLLYICLSATVWTGGAFAQTKPLYRLPSGIPSNIKAVPEGEPLIIGCDIRKMPEEAKAILTNREVIAINQDPALNQPYRVDLDRCPEDMLVYTRLLEGGDFAVGVFNMSDADYRFVFGLDEIGITTNCGRKAVAKELWSGEEQPLRCDSFDLTVEPHGARLFRCKLVSK